MKFKGDIIITDPCYIIKDNSDDWNKCGWGENMGILGFTTYISEYTLCGDWSCSTWSTPRKDVEAQLDEVLKYNPDFDYHINREWTTTLIKDFDGEVNYYVDSGDDARIIGVGNINFFTS